MCTIVCVLEEEVLGWSVWGCDVHRGGSTGTISALHRSKASPTHMDPTISILTFVNVQVSWDASECHECLRQSSCLCVFLMIARACVCFYAHVCPSLSAWLCIFCGALISEWSWRVLFDFNLSWNPLLLSQVTLSLFLFSCFFSFRSYCHKTKQTARQCLYRSDTFPKSRPEFSKSHSGAWL